MARRAAVVILCGLLLVGCQIAPAASLGTSDGSASLWIVRNLDAERVGDRTSVDLRLHEVLSSRLDTAGRVLGTEDGELRQRLSACPGPATELRTSDFDAERDGLRLALRVGAIPNPANSASSPAAETSDDLAAGTAAGSAIAGYAQADWYLRRANATGDASYCDRATTALQAGRLALAQAQSLESGGNGPPAPVAPAPPVGALRLVVNPGSLQSLPFVAAINANAFSQSGISLSIVRANNGRVADPVRTGAADAVAARPSDLSDADKADLDQVVAYFTRSPVAFLSRFPDQASPTLLTGVVGAYPASPTSAPVLSGLVTQPIPDSWEAAADYRLGAVDALVDEAPWPQYLAEERGAIVWDASLPDAPRQEAAGLFAPKGIDPGVRAQLSQVAQVVARWFAGSDDAQIVDLVVADYPDWEPDALLQAVPVVRRSLAGAP